jgi:hypothetical protein
MSIVVFFMLLGLACAAFSWTLELCCSFTAKKQATSSEGSYWTIRDTELHVNNNAI